MPAPHLLDIKPSHKAVKQYFELIDRYGELSIDHEGAVRAAFQSLLESCARQFNWTLISEWKIKRKGQNSISVDGALVDEFKLTHGFWEAKDTNDDLDIEIKKKFAVGYPRNNILFQSPDRAILYRDGKRFLDEDIRKAGPLVEVLKSFFEYQPPYYEEWERAVDEFKQRVPEIATALVSIIDEERKTNSGFILAFEEFVTLCRTAINPNLSLAAVEEMLVQHILTERIFSRVFNNPDFAQRNVIALEIEKVIRALTSHSFSRSAFLARLDRFYTAIETTAATIDDFSQKQGFLNTVYEQFFRGFSVKVADTHGIVYTPQSIVNFMVNSVQELLQTEFGKSVADRDVHLLDPFVGTGNFLVRLMQKIPKTALGWKYQNDLHCNEVMLLPYYIASMNIEHEYFDATGQYEPFPGICLVDTFEMAEQQQAVFTTQNTERIARQNNSPIFVIIGNPPYNVGQVNENDNNKNRKYPTVDKRVSALYTKSSSATNKNSLSDPYIKAFRWATDRLTKEREEQVTRTDEGIIAFVTNSGFVDGIAFDGMRKQLFKEFSSIYVLDLGGNVRKNPKLSGTSHNVFGIQVGVSITFLVKKKQESRAATLRYARLDEYWRKEQKYEFLESTGSIDKIEWHEIVPDAQGTWLREGMKKEFDSFLALGTAEGRRGQTHTVFGNYGRGVATSRDAWVYNFNEGLLINNVKRTIDSYNAESQIYRNASKEVVDKALIYDDQKVSWSESLKLNLVRGRTVSFDPTHVRRSLYRPYTEEFLYFDRILNERVYQAPRMFPTLESELDNRVICVSGIGSSKPFQTLATASIPCLDLLEKTQSFPFYTYDETGGNRKENISDYVLGVFRDRYSNATFTKWDIFHYTYAVLHHSEYRKLYAENLRRSLPRVPFAADFRRFADSGILLVGMHVEYEKQEEFSLEMIESSGTQLSWRVEKMKLSRDKTQIQYNDFLTLAGIPPEALEYRLGNRSALEWVIDQYQVKTDKRSGITNDPNRADDPEYIVRLIKQVITVSLETMKIVKGLPGLETETPGSRGSSRL